MALLLLAAGLAWAFGETLEAGAILAVILMNSGIGFLTELRAVRSMEALRKLGSVRTRVRRSGSEVEIPAQHLVPGDIVLLEGGDVITADLRVLEASRLHADEALLTGESVPVEKSPEQVPPEAPLAEHRSMVYKGTSLTRGAGLGVVVRTGNETELGRLAALVERAEDELTPLEVRLDQLGGQLLWVTLAMVLLVTGGGVAAGNDLYVTLETGISLAVASVPEGLPIVATMALARGMWRLARRNALITSLAAVETLGATTVILTDKTGTLTRNRMRWSLARLADGEVERTIDGSFVRQDAAVVDPRGGPLGRLLEAGALCSDAALEGREGVGDPLEVALLEAAASAGWSRPELLRAHPEVCEEAFDAQTRRMTTVHRDPEGYRVFVKGAPEVVLPDCGRVAAAEGETPLDEAAREGWESAVEGLARRGLRVLALATRVMASPEPGAKDRGLTLLGLVALEDPPREEVAAALETCRRAGVRVVMVTGDHAATAASIARAVGLVPKDEALEVVEGRQLPAPGEWDEATRRRLARVPVFARVSPEQKLALIGLYQDLGEVVAMTGDGVNDAPALRRSDIGVAMGARGTQVAQEAADMVLLDDSFATIVVAMAQGRVILGNIRNFLVYLLSCNLAEILVIGMAGGLGLPLPILPLQILYLNLVTDVFPAFALGFGEEDGDVMARPPRPPGVPILEARHWWRVAGYGVVLASCTLAAFRVALARAGGDPDAAVAVAFATLSLAQTLHVFNMRDPGTRWTSNEITRNPFVWAAVVVCAGLTGLAMATPGLSSVLRLSLPDAVGCVVVLGFSAAPVALRILVGR